VRSDEGCVASPMQIRVSVNMSSQKSLATHHSQRRRTATADTTGHVNAPFNTPDRDLSRPPYSAGHRTPSQCFELFSAFDRGRPRSWAAVVDRSCQTTHAMVGSDHTVRLTTPTGAARTGPRACSCWSPVHLYGCTPIHLPGAGGHVTGEASAVQTRPKRKSRRTCTKQEGNMRSASAHCGTAPAQAPQS
jgi:hypothetical protein